jgi:hypothetical protein
VEFANQYQLWGVEEWKKVMFCEESHFELRFDNQATHCRRLTGSDRSFPKFNRKMLKHPQKVVVWVLEEDSRTRLVLVDASHLQSLGKYLDNEKWKVVDLSRPCWKVMDSAVRDLMTDVGTQ